MTLEPLLALGFVAGVRHATDTDHVVAVTALVSRERSFRSALALGGFWGLGHMLTLLAIGAAVVGCGLVIPSTVGLWLEMAVAVVLVLLGVANIGVLVRGLAGKHDHAVVPTSLSLDAAPHGRSSTSLRRGSRSLAVGAVHGLAGSAAVILLVVASERRLLPALGCLVLFGAGTLVGMLLVTATFALPLRIATTRFASLERAVAGLTGVLSVAVGLFLAYQITHHG